MKSPLGYQTSEYDCGPVSILNCIKYLFQREEISAYVVIQIFHSGMDEKGSDKQLGEGGTSKYEMARIWNILELLLPISVIYQRNDKVSASDILNCLKEGGCVLLRTFLDDIEHYVLVTGYDCTFYYLWDPYFLSLERSNDMIIIDLNYPFKFNRIVSKEILEREEIGDFSLGPIISREIICVNRR